MNKWEMRRLKEIKSRLRQIKYEKVALKKELEDLLASCTHPYGYNDAGFCTVCDDCIDAW
jgi:hypothetical protein